MSGQSFAQSFASSRNRVRIQSESSQTLRTSSPTVNVAEKFETVGDAEGSQLKLKQAPVSYRRRSPVCAIPNGNANAKHRYSVLLSGIKRVKYSVIRRAV